MNTARMVDDITVRTAAALFVVMTDEEYAVLWERAVTVKPPVGRPAGPIVPE